MPRSRTLPNASSPPSRRRRAARSGDNWTAPAQGRYRLRHPSDLEFGRDVEHRDRLAQALEGEVADLFEPGVALDRGGDAFRHQDLAVRRGVAEARGEIDHRADRG